MKRHRRWALAVAGALSAGLIAGCSTTGPASSPEATQAASESASAANGALESETEDGEAQEQEPTRPSIPEVEFTVDHTDGAQHGLEVSVSFTLEGSVENSEGNVVQAVSRAVDMHPDYDLIIVRGYGAGDDPTDGSPTIEAWFMPENVESLDLDDPAQAEPYEHCYSCHLPGHHS